MSKILIDKLQVYEKIWTGHIDQILSYDTDTHMFTVMDVASKAERTHCTSLNAHHLFSSTTDKPGSFDSEVLKYLISIGITNITALPSEFGELIYDTTDTVQKLILSLQKLDEEYANSVRLTLDDKDYPIELMKEIETLACGCLISQGGGCHWENIAKLRDLGYNVFPGEKDSFGWLTGCIRTKTGIVIVYG